VTLKDDIELVRAALKRNEETTWEEVDLRLASERVIALAEARRGRTNALLEACEAANLRNDDGVEGFEAPVCEHGYAVEYDQNGTPVCPRCPAMAEGFEARVLCSGCGAEFADPWDSHDGAGFSGTGAVRCPACGVVTWYEREVCVSFRRCAELAPPAYRDIRRAHIIKAGRLADPGPEDTRTEAEKQRAEQVRDVGSYTELTRRLK